MKVLIFAGAKLTFNGTNTHPGTAKNKMRNATKLAMEFNGYLPVEEAPEYTEGYEGFYHLLSLNGDVEQSKAYYIIRDFDRENFEARKNNVKNIVKTMQEKYGEDAVVLEMNDHTITCLKN